MTEVFKEVLQCEEKTSNYETFKDIEYGRVWIKVWSIIYSPTGEEEAWKKLKEQGDVIEKRYNVRCLVAISPSDPHPTLFVENTDMVPALFRDLISWLLFDENENRGDTK